MTSTSSSSSIIWYFAKQICLERPFRVIIILHLLQLVNNWDSLGKGILVPEITFTIGVILFGVSSNLVLWTLGLDWKASWQGQSSWWRTRWAKIWRRGGSARWERHCLMERWSWKINYIRPSMIKLCNSLCVGVFKKSLESIKSSTLRLESLSLMNPMIANYSVFSAVY